MVILQFIEIDIWMRASYFGFNAEPLEELY